VNGGVNIFKSVHVVSTSFHANRIVTLTDRCLEVSVKEESLVNIDVFTQSSLAIQIHMLTAIGAFFLGAYVLMRRKGTLAHKIAGRVFALLMVTTAITAIFIRNINDGSFSWIHIFVPMTFIGLYQVISSIRRGDVKLHRKHVFSMYFAALIIPGLFAFMPGRTMWMLFFA